MSITGSISRTGRRSLGDQAGGQVAKRPGLASLILRQRLAVTGLILVTIFTVVAILGPLVAPHGPTEQFSQDRLQSPSAAYPFGTDEFGRDILSRLLYGARISFEVGLIAVGLAGTLGVVLGMVAGYRGGWLDNILTLLMDVVFAFPAILLAIATITMLGNSLANVMIAIAVVYTPTFMRVVPGGDAVGPASGVRRSGRRHRHSDVAHFNPAHLPEHHRAADRSRFTQLRLRGTGRSLARLSRPRQ